MPRTLLANYPAESGRYDELFAAPGALRPHWQPLMHQLARESAEQMRQQLAFLDRRLQENGVTYNAYADAGGGDRPWVLDPLPFILPAKEWAEIAAGVTQRARVIDAALADLYGPQKLLSEGLLPPALVYGQHGFLWPCVGSEPVGGHHLHFYAADLVRSPDGRWWVIADRTQAPTGTGYVLENRLIVSRLFPELFRGQRVQHVAYFYRAVQEALAAWAPVDPGEQPHIVLLTPGPYNETYFEQAYLSRYLGYPLVEGQDLTMRDNTVYLKTLTGLKRVHVILRRQDDDYCDPLELRGDSALGVPGLLQAIRARRVLVTNALGSGIMSSGALMGFLPGICERLLGEELAMPSVATWWCGEKPALSYAIEHFDELVFKGAYPTQRFQTLFGNKVQGTDRAELLRRLKARPHAFVAQETVRAAQAPIWHRGVGTLADRVQARPIGLRVYVAATPQGYVVMPGGLARVSGRADEQMISMQRGGMAKDTWVLTEGAVDLSSLIKPTLTTRDLVRSGSNLTSRVVESLYWLGRYAERFDNTARFLRVCLQRLHDAGNELTPELAILLDLGEQLEVLEPESVEVDSVTKPRASTVRTKPLASLVSPLETRVLRSIHDAACAGGLAANIRSTVWSATQVKERLSVDHWHTLSSLQRRLQSLKPEQLNIREAQVFLEQVLQASSSLNGYTMDNMTRDDGWRFLVLGRRVERLGYMATAVATALRLLAKHEPIALEWLLELADSIITYRSRYSRRPELLAIIDLIVLDPDNPHSVFFQMQVVQRYLARLHRALGETPIDLLETGTELLLNFDLSGFEAQEEEAFPEHHCLALAELLESIVQSAYDLSDQLAMRYFTHVGDIGQQTLGT